jgi:pimeloyl-ACP methyl ester carboxylesterase
MSLLQRDGYHLHWERTGSGSPVLLIMGAVYSSAMWYPALPLLRARHELVSFDNQGTGRSTWQPGVSIEDLAADALAVLDAAGLETAHVYGISLGGVLALELATAAPERVRSLVLGCTCVLTPDKPRAPIEVNDALLAATRRNLADGTLYGSVCPPEAKARNHRAILEDSAVPQALVAQQDALRAYQGRLSDVADLTMPTLVLHGTEDPVVPVEWGRELAATLPDSRLIEYEGCGHNYLVEVGDAPTLEVLAFLAELDAAEPLAESEAS